MENPDNLGEQLHAIAEGMPLDAAHLLGEQIEETSAAFSATTDGSNAPEINEAKAAIETARQQAAEALAALNVAKNTINGYTERIGYGGGQPSGTDTSRPATPAPQTVSGAVDPGLHGKSTEQPAPKPAELSPAEKAIYDEDADFQVSYVEEVRPRPDGKYDVVTSTGIIDTAEDGTKPKIGEEVRQYVEGGGRVRGLVVGGRIQHYRSEQEEEIQSAMHRLEITESNEARKSELYDGLPPVIQDRVDREHLNTPPEDAGIADMLYVDKLIEANAAHQLAQKYKTPEAIETLMRKPFTEQLAAEPDIAYNIDRGNPQPQTMHKLLGYAKWYLQAERERGQQ